ncbi:MAG: hypothetical protein OSA11_00675 [Candidatus Nanopelagicales bacterium]|nr:hypothetical protein [Candidatus Nanopelagicales bacterium]
MKVKVKSDPRIFPVGIAHTQLSHVADIDLESDEMVTFVTDEKLEYDVCRKSWGYYATPSLGGRLRAFGWRAAVMRNKDTRHCFVVLVQEGREDEWMAYMLIERQELVLWIDDFETLSGMPAVGGLGMDP